MREVGKVKVTMISEYELQIQRNIEERKRMFEMLQLNKAKKELVDVLVKPCKRKLEVGDVYKGERRLAKQVQCAQFGMKKYWYQSSIMTFYQFSEETKNMQPNSKQDVIGVCIICEKQITGQIIFIKNWKNHLQNCHQEVPEWKEYSEKTQEIKEQRMRNLSGIMPSSLMTVHKPKVQHTLSQLPMLGMMPNSPYVKEVKCHVPPSLPFQRSSRQPPLAFGLQQESISPCRPDSTISECCMIEETDDLLMVKPDTPNHTIRTRRQSKRN